MHSQAINAVKVGQLFANVFPGPGVITTIVSPSQNLFGLVIRTLTIVVDSNAAAGVTTGVNIFADTDAPATTTDFTKRVIFQRSTIGTSDVSATLPYELYLYPRMGIWLGSSARAANAFITYDLVSMEFQ